MLPNIGWSELLIILIIVLLLFGAKRLPELAKSLGASLNAFKKGMKEGSDGSEKSPETPHDKIE